MLFTIIYICIYIYIYTIPHRWFFVFREYIYIYTYIIRKLIRVHLTVTLQSNRIHQSNWINRNQSIKSSRTKPIESNQLRMASSTERVHATACDGIEALHGPTGETTVSPAIFCTSIFDSGRPPANIPSHRRSYQKLSVPPANIPFHQQNYRSPANRPHRGFLTVKSLWALSGISGISGVSGRMGWTAWGLVGRPWFGLAWSALFVRRALWAHAPGFSRGARFNVFPGKFIEVWPLSGISGIS